ncbi:hypothetical protein LSAT2_008695 [Lamellibrachia satsuma]|nr:hypothetical protein LSAT2_008695 [Lamellibrachia satsuma]
MHFVNTPYLTFCVEKDKQTQAENEEYRQRFGCKYNALRALSTVDVVHGYRRFVQMDYLNLKWIQKLSFADTLVFITVVLFVLCIIAAFIYLIILKCGSSKSVHKHNQYPGQYPPHGAVSTTSHQPETRVHPYFSMKHKVQTN